MDIDTNTTHSWIFHEIELASRDDFNIKSWILTAITLYPEDVNLKTSLFAHLIKNEPELYRNEIDELFHELLTRSDNSATNSKFWSPLEATLLDLKQLATNKNADEIDSKIDHKTDSKTVDNEKKISNSLAKYIWSLPSKKQHEILKNVIDRASQITGNLQNVTRLALKLVEYDSSSFVDKLKDMMEKLLGNEKEIYSDKMNKYQNQGPGVTQMISLVNYANLYRKCYIFDVLLNYLEHLSENDKADGKKRKEERGSGSSKADKSSIQAKHATRNFRKALEFGIGSQMFQAIEFRSLNVEESDCGDNDRDYLAEYWSVIDRLRKMTGKLIRWKPDDSSNLKELWNRVVLPLSKSQTENQADSKQIFYTCLQIFVQASGAYTELVEPALITGNDDKKSSLVLTHEGCNSILSTTNLNTTATSNFHSTQPKKYGCTALELLKIVQECEKILENEQICGPDWTNQMKKRWYTEKMPFWVVVNADLSFLNGRYDNCTFDLARLDSLLESAKYFDKPDVKRALKRRIALYKIISAVELKQYTNISNFMTDELLESVCDIGNNNSDGFFCMGSDYLRRLKCYSIINGINIDKNEDIVNVKSIQSETPKYDSTTKTNDQFYVIASQLFWKAQPELREKVRTILDKIVDQVRPTEDFNFVEVLKNLENTELIEDVHDARLRWKDKYRKRKLVENEKAAKTVKTAAKRSRKDKRKAATNTEKQPEVDASKSVLPPDEQAYNNELYKALSRDGEVESDNSFMLMKKLDSMFDSVK